jgi:AcrR family transcriptional regulator
MDRAEARRAATTRRVRVISKRQRNELIEVGFTLFGQRAYRDLDTTEICEASGITPDHFYHCFGTKRDFFVAVVGRAVERLFALTAPEDPTRPLDDLEHSIAAYFDFLRRHPQAALAVAQHADGGAEIEAALEPLRERTRVGLAHSLGADLVDDHVDLVLWSWSGLAQETATRLITRPQISTLTAARLTGLSLIQLVEDSLRLQGNELPPTWEGARQRIRRASAN